MTRKKNGEATSKQAMRERIAELEDEVNNLHIQLQNEPNNKTHAIKEFFRKALLIFLVLLTGIWLNFGIIALWLRRDFLTSENWVATASEMIQDPAIRQQVSATISRQIFTAVDVDQYVADILPEQIKPLATPLARSMESFTTSRIDEALQSEAFLSFWETANQAAHAGLIESLENQGVPTESAKNTDPIYINGDELVLNTKPIFASVQTRLVEGGLSFVGRLNPDRFAQTIVLTRIQSMEAILFIFNLINRLAVLLPIVAMVTGSLAVYISKNRRKTLIAIGMTTIVLMVLNVQTILLARLPIVNNIATALQQSNTAAAQAMYDILTRDYILMSRTLLVIATFLTLTAFLSGPNTFAVWIRKKLGSVLVNRGKDAAVTRALTNHTTGILIGIAVVVFLLLTFPIVKGAVYVVTIMAVGSILALFIVSIRQASKNHITEKNKNKKITK